MVSWLFISLIVVSLATILMGYRPAEYPAYCSKDMPSRAITPLSSSERLRVTNLLQVQAMIRHGARTPYARLSCWKGYSVRWNDCNITELMATALSSSGGNGITAPRMLYRKIYDGSPNLLGGNCLTGQLIYEGYEQISILGKHFRNAYLTNSDLKLFDKSHWSDVKHLVYLRSDDEQRTLMSGQILVYSMFGIDDDVVVDWHTGDRALDQISPNDRACPRLDVASRNALASPAWLSYNNSDKVLSLTKKLDEVFGRGFWTWYDALDCIMTTVCTDQNIPDGQSPMTDSLFADAIKHVEYGYSYLAGFNESEYSKLAIGNTAWHIARNIKDILGGKDAARFVLYSAHDTSLMTFLSAILESEYDGQWPGYASAIALELYQANESYVVRMVLNGKPLLIPGCDEYLCSVNVLLKKLGFAKEFMPCSLPLPQGAEVTMQAEKSIRGFDVYDWVALCVMSTLMGSLVGAAVVVFSYKRKAERGEIEIIQVRDNEDSTSFLIETEKQ